MVKRKYKRKGNYDEWEKMETEYIVESKGTSPKMYLKNGDVVIINNFLLLFTVDKKNSNVFYLTRKDYIAKFDMSNPKEAKMFDEHFETEDRSVIGNIIVNAYLYRYLDENKIREIITFDERYPKEKMLQYPQHVMYIPKEFQADCTREIHLDKRQLNKLGMWKKYKRRMFLSVIAGALAVYLDDWKYSKYMLLATILIFCISLVVMFTKKRKISKTKMYANVFLNQYRFEHLKGYNYADEKLTKSKYATQKWVMPIKGFIKKCKWKIKENKTNKEYYTYMFCDYQDKPSFIWMSRNHFILKVFNGFRVHSDGTTDNLRYDLRPGIVRLKVPLIFEKEVLRDIIVAHKLTKYYEIKGTYREFMLEGTIAAQTPESYRDEFLPNKVVNEYTTPYNKIEFI